MISYGFSDQSKSRMEHHMVGYNLGFLQLLLQSWVFIKLLAFMGTRSLHNLEPWRLNFLHCSFLLRDVRPVQTRSPIITQLNHFEIRRVMHELMCACIRSWFIGSIVHYSFMFTGWLICSFIRTIDRLIYWWIDCLLDPLNTMLDSLNTMLDELTQAIHVGWNTMNCNAQPRKTILILTHMHDKITQ